MNIQMLTAWVETPDVIEPATVPMAFRIGSATFFLNESESGIAKAQEIIDVLQQMITAFQESEMETLNQRQTKQIREYEGAVK